MSRAPFGLVALLLISAFLGSCRDAEIGKIWLTLHPFEQLATRNGPKIVVSINGKPAGELNANAPDLLVSLPSEKKFDFAYVGPSGELTDVSWSQTVKPNEQKLVVMQPWRRPRSRASLADYCLGEAGRQQESFEASAITKSGDCGLPHFVEN